MKKGTSTVQLPRSNRNGAPQVPATAVPANLAALFNGIPDASVAKPVAPVKDGKATSNVAYSINEQGKLVATVDLFGAPEESSASYIVARHDTFMPKDTGLKINGRPLMVCKGTFFVKK